jgi:hypothetical protein
MAATLEREAVLNALRVVNDPTSGATSYRSAS